MANQQRIAPGFPFPVYVNETATKQRIALGVFFDETIAASASSEIGAQYRRIGLDGVTMYGGGLVNR